MSKPYSLNTLDFAKGCMLAVIVAILGALQQLFLAHGFDLSSWDWGFLINIVVTAFLGYMTKQFVSDANTVPFGHAHTNSY